MNIIIYDGVLPLILVSLGFSSLVAGIAQCSIRHKESINYLSAMSHLSFGFFLIAENIYLFVAGARSPFLLLISQSLLAVCYLFVYLYFRSLFFRKSYDSRLIVSVFIPGLIIIGIFMAQYISGICRTFFSSGSGPYFPVITETTTRSIVYLWGSFCFSKAVWDFRDYQKDGSTSAISSANIFYLFIIFSALILIFVSFIFISGSSLFGMIYKFALLYYGIFITSMVFFSYRYPDFFNIIRMETSRVKYSKSKLRGLNVETVIERLYDLMINEKLFLDENLTLANLSAILDLTPHQLSEILNKELDSNFNIFINSFRIKEAEKILLAHRERTILNIALSCGFNSKTAFNKSFTAVTGKTPSEYRTKRRSQL